MIIKIDARERKIIALCNELLQKYEIKNVTIEVIGLPLGDMIITTDDGEEKLLIERKSLADLASSICDGRYKEQSFRLQNYPVHNHNIVYVIEGNMEYYVPKVRRITKQTLYSAILGIQYNKGFSVFRTHNLKETAEYLVRISDKLQRTSDPPFYNNNLILEKEDNKDNKDTNTNTNTNKQQYSQVIKKNKKENITPQNIGEIMLMQIPGVSSTNAITIIKEFGSFMKVIDAVKEHDVECLKKLTYETKTGKKRHISSTCCNNIVKYLIEKKEEVLFVET